METILLVTVIYLAIIASVPKLTVQKIQSSCSENKALCKNDFPFGQIHWKMFGQIH